MESRLQPAALSISQRLSHFAAKVGFQRSTG
jgi:hypothetical protein